MSLIKHAFTSSEQDTTQVIRSMMGGGWRVDRRTQPSVGAQPMRMMGTYTAVSNDHALYTCARRVMLYAISLIQTASISGESHH
jgi:hypothetical protein